MQYESKCDQNTWRKVGIPVPILNLFSDFVWRIYDTVLAHGFRHYCAKNSGYNDTIIPGVSEKDP